MSTSYRIQHKYIGIRAERPTRTLAASVLPLVSHFEYMLDVTDRQTDRQINASRLTLPAGVTIHQTSFIVSSAQRALTFVTKDNESGLFVVRRDVVCGLRRGSDRQAGTCRSGCQADVVQVVYQRLRQRRPSATSSHPPHRTRHAVTQLAQNLLFHALDLSADGVLRRRVRATPVTTRGGGRRSTNCARFQFQSFIALHAGRRRHQKDHQNGQQQTERAIR